MAQRDYAARSGAKKKKKQRKSNKSMLLMLAIMIVAAFAFGLYLLKESAGKCSTTARNCRKNTAEKCFTESSGRSVELYQGTGNTYCAD